MTHFLNKNHELGLKSPRDF